MRFNVTYEIITPESAEHCDVEESGFLVQDASLREAVALIDGCAGNGYEANEYPVSDPRWITAYRVAENYTTGATENRSLHLPDEMTIASKMRLCRYLGVYGCK